MSEANAPDHPAKLQKKGAANIAAPFFHLDFESPVLDRFGHMLAGNLSALRNVGDAALHPEHPVVGPCRKVQGIDGLPDQRFPSSVRPAIPFGFLYAQLGIRLSLAAHLKGSRGLDPHSHAAAGFSGIELLQVLERNGGHFDAHVYPVEKGA